MAEISDSEVSDGFFSVLDVFLLIDVVVFDVVFGGRVGVIVFIVDTGLKVVYRACALGFVASGAFVGDNIGLVKVENVGRKVMNSLKIEGSSFAEV